MELTVKQKKFKSFLTVVIWTVFILIAAGGIVRSTGSGMGCPDWPKCFGSYVPPTDISQLPADYKIKYAVAGRVIADFTPIKTWTEYINRLLGAWTGIASLILSFLAFSYKKRDVRVFWYSHLSLFLVILNGYLGSKVVSSHLMPGVISAHMILAVFLVFALLRIKKIISTDIEVKFFGLKEELNKYKNISLVILLLVIVQIIFGSQVREQVDHITRDNPGLMRADWVNNLGTVFYIHRSFSILIVLGLYGLLRKLMTYFKESSKVQGMCIKIMMIIIAEITAGMSLAYFKFPLASQPIHLLLAVFLVSYVFELYMELDSAAV